MEMVVFDKNEIDLFMRNSENKVSQKRKYLFNDRFTSAF